MVVYELMPMLIPYVFLESSFWSPFGKVLPENFLPQSLMHKRTKGRNCVCSGAVEKEAE